MYCDVKEKGDRKAAFFRIEVLRSCLRHQRASVMRMLAMLSPERRTAW